jgi:hypothetical protein
MFWLGELIVKLLAGLFFIPWPVHRIRAWGRNNRWHFQIFGANNVYLTRDVDKIDRYHDEKAWEVQNECSLRPGLLLLIIRIPNERKQSHEDLL